MPAAAAYANCRERLIDALSLIHRQLADDTYASGPEHALEIPAPTATPRELLETRDPIDELGKKRWGRKGVRNLS